MMGMSMTIEDAKEHLSQYIGDNRVDYDDLDAIEVAINTMRKYQKIEQIYREWFSDTGRTSADAYVRIGEVLKDRSDKV